MEIKIKKDTKKYNEYNVTMKLTHGQILAIKHALEHYSTAVIPGSAVAADVYEALKRRMEEAGLQ